MRLRELRYLGWAFVLTCVLTGCVVTGPRGGGGSPTPIGVCTPGAVSACACVDGTAGTQRCTSLGDGFERCSQGCVCPDGRSGTRTCDGALGACACALAAVCAPGQSRACTCTDGRTGAQVCDALGAGFGVCACSSPTPTCSRAVDQPCASSAECCPQGAVATLCVSYEGVGQRCVARCTRGTDCTSGCCARLSDGTLACGPAAQCRTGVCSPGQTRACSCADGASGSQTCDATGTGFGLCACASPTCTRAAGQSCVRSAECCPAGGVATVCVNYAGVGQLCAARCTRNADCSNNCCARLADGTLACGPTTACAAPTCSRTFGQSCSGDAECCPDAATGRGAVCTNYSGSATCWARCSVNADCASGCCTTRTDGVRTCGPLAACP